MTQFNVKNVSLALEDGGEKKVPVPHENKQWKSTGFTE